MELYQLFRALGDETRLSIVQLLLEHSYCGRALSRKLGISEAAVSQQLKVLREAGLLVSERCGSFCHYTVNQTALAELAAELDRLSKAECQPCTLETGGCELADFERCRSGSCHCKNKKRRACCRKQCAH